MNIYEYATRIQGNIRLTSDNVGIQDCYWLCANKQHIDDLRVLEHQVIWGRRGTGKTTLLKAFVYDINYKRNSEDYLAFYIMMARMIPTSEEIRVVTDDGSGLAVYVFSKLIGEICRQLTDVFDAKSSIMTEEEEDSFLEAYLQLVEYIRLYQTRIQGGELSIESISSEETKKESVKSVGVKAKTSLSILSGCFDFLKKHNKALSHKDSFAVSGKILFHLETQRIEEYLSQILDSLGISTAFICLDEYSEIDKLSTYSIQSQVAQLIKQVFFKSQKFSVKIATIWNKSKLHERGGNRVEGIEYKQDIFAGPDLDIMFMEHNVDVISYFKELLVNTYLMYDEMSFSEREKLADYFESEIFGESGLRHLICGSQGISRSFVILIKEYIRRFVKDKCGPLKLGIVYEMIKHQYLEDVRNKIPYYTVYRNINDFIASRLCRYFLINRQDYDRCKEMIKYLATRGVFMQMPGHLTDRCIRDDYKLFVINYGNYLDALESASHKKGRKTLEEDAKLKANGLLLPEYDTDMLEKPGKYTVFLSNGAENEFYCVKCRKIFVHSDRKVDTTCPTCGRVLQRFEEFIDEVSL